MAKGQKTGGRSKGTPNRRTVARRQGVEDLLERYAYDPLEAMIAEASDQNVDPEVRRSLHMAIAPYVYPKLKTVEAKVTSELQSVQELLCLSDDEAIRCMVQAVPTHQLVRAIGSMNSAMNLLLGGLPESNTEELENAARMVLARGQG